MPKAIIDSLDQVAEPFRTEYEPGTADQGLEGKFILKVEGQDGWGLENTNGLKNALSTTRTDLSTANKSLKAFEGLDPIKAREAMDKVVEFSKLDPKKDVDKLVEEKLQAQLGELNSRHRGELEGRDKRIGMRDSLLTDTFKTAAAVKAISEAKGDVDLLLPHVLPSIKFDLEEADGKLVPKTKVVDASGNVRIGAGSDGSNMTISERIQELKNDARFSKLFEGAGHPGSGDQGRSQSSGGSEGGAPLNLGNKKIVEMSRKERAALIRKIGQSQYTERSNAERAAAA